MPEVIDFHKVEGLGNDFLLVDWRRRDDWRAALEQIQRRAPALCDRRRGVGGDGLLLVTPTTTDGCDAAMIVVNHDGSIPEMCGNGLRCVAFYLHAAAAVGDTMVLETGAGPLPCAVMDAAPRHGQVRIEMGPARDLGERTPDAGDGRGFRAISTGNPHAIAFVGADEDPEALARTHGPAIERDPLFPHRTNVEFARVEADGAITLWVWERGCGITEACGTGACATAAAAVGAGLARAGEPLRVQLPGGWLTIEVPEDPQASVVMTGPARLVFRGSVALSD
ncbi:MAG: diaminopimelate epimerase [Myxococcales bacterium]|nr:diaminopimelate epimerase [Myxococcales bacterium]